MRTTLLLDDMNLERKIWRNGKEVWAEMNREELMRPREVARQLAVSRSTVYRWFWEGRLRGIKLNGGTLRILASAVQEKLAEAD
jgi:excisionase family DNA binding protein